MKLSQILKIFKSNNVKLDVHGKQKVFHGGFNKTTQQFDFRFQKDGSWKSGSFTVVWSTNHTVEHSQKSDATSDDGMRSLYHDYQIVIETTNDDPTVYKLYCKHHHYNDEVTKFINDNFVV